MEICRNESTGFKALKRFWDVEVSKLDDIPCARMDILLGLPTTDNNIAERNGTITAGRYYSGKTAFIVIYLKMAIKVKRTILDYDGMTLFADLGGYTGLFLGVSVAESIILMNTILQKIVVKKFVKETTESCN